MLRGFVKEDLLLFKCFRRIDNRRTIDKVWLADKGCLQSGFRNKNILDRVVSIGSGHLVMERVDALMWRLSTREVGSSLRHSVSILVEQLCFVWARHLGGVGKLVSSNWNLPKGLWYSLSIFWNFSHSWLLIKVTLER